MSGVTKNRFALCWNCYHATNPDGKCPWSSRLDPVPGWVAEPCTNKGYKTFLVLSCPLFARDAENGGSVRIKKKGGRSG